MKEFIDIVVEHLGDRTPKYILEAKNKEELISFVQSLCSNSYKEYGLLKSRDFEREIKDAWDLFKACDNALFDIENKSKESI